MKRRHGSVAAVVLMALVGTSTTVAGAAPARSGAVVDSAAGDAVLDWNQHATDALIGTAGQGPTVAVLHLAMVLLVGRPTPQRSGASTFSSASTERIQPSMSGCTGIATRCCTPLAM